MIFISHKQNQCNIKKLRKRRVAVILRITEVFGKRVDLLLQKGLERVK